MVLYGKTVNVWKRTLIDTVKVQKDYTTEEVIFVTKKAVKASKLPTIKVYWRKLCPHVLHNFTQFTTELSREL